MGNALAACLQLIEQDPTWQGAHEDDGSGAEGEIEPACEPQDVCTWCFLNGIEPADLLACAACGVRADRDCARHATPADACSSNEPWHCDACRWGLRPEALACALCGKRGAQNLLMRATACNGWVHRACAYWGETVEDTADDAFAKINPNCQDHKGKCSICKKAGVKGQILLECMHSECRVKFHAYCMMLERPRRTVRCGEHTRPGGRDARRFHYCAKHRKAADALHDKEEWDLDPETDAPPPFSLPFRRRRCVRAAAAAAALREAAAVLGAVKDAPLQKSAVAALAVRGSGSGDSVAAAAGIAAADAAAGSAAPAAGTAAAASSAAATATTITRARGSGRAAAAAVAAVLETTAAATSADGAAAVARVLAALSDAIDAAPMPGLRHAWAVSCLLALLASDAARAGALGALLLPPPRSRGSAAPSSASSASGVKEEEEEGEGEAEALLLLRGALLRADLSLSRAALVGGDRAVADAALTRTAMGRCPAQLEMAVRAGAARAHAARGALAPLVRAQQLRAATDGGGSSGGGGGTSGGAATIKWRGTACVACLEPQGAAPWHHCHMCGVHFHVKCAAKVAHRLKRGGGGGGGGDGDGGDGDGGDGGGGSSGSGGARKYRCRVCAASEALRGAAQRRNLADVYKILRATTCADPAHQPHPRASVTALHLAARQGWYEGLSLMLHAARVAAGASGDGVPFGAGAALRGGLPRVCLPAAAIPGSQKRLTAYDVTCEQHDMASAYVLRTTYEGMDPDDRTVLYQWPRGARLGRDISCGLERVPVPWLNEVDDEPFPSDEFTYVTRVIEGRGVVFNWQLASPRAPRPCTRCGSKSKRKRGEDASAPPKCAGCAAHNQRQSARTECNMLCPCYQVAPSGAVVNCGMRAAQQGVDRQLLVFKHRGVKGWGVRTLEWLPQDCLVCVYAGEVVTMEEYEERETVYTEQKKGSYGFYCSASHSARTLWVIDATVYRNVGGFLNHACGESNLKMVRVVGECGAATAAPNAGLPAFAPATYALITTRTIERGEELTFHYGDSKMRFEPCFCAPCTRAKQRKDEAAKRSSTSSSTSS